MSEDGNLLTKIGSSITNALETVKDIQKMQIDYSVKEKTYDLLDKLLDIKNNQLEFFEMLDKSKEKINELEQYIKSIDQWSKKKESHELFHPVRGTTVYRSSFLAILKMARIIFGLTVIILIQSLYFN